MYQTGPQQFYTFTPNPEQLYLTCDSTEESNGYKVSTVKIVGFNLLNISTGCRGVLPAHVFSTSTSLSTNFEMQIDSFSFELTNLFKEDVSERDIKSLLSDSSHAKVTITDIRKNMTLKN